MVLFGGGSIMGIAGLVLLDNVTPLTIDEINELDPHDINSFDQSSVGPYRATAAGDVMLYGSFLLPLTFAANSRTRHDWQILSIIGVEVLLVQSGLNGIVKGVTQRTRPYVYDPNTPQEKKTSKDARMSFYSGHTSTAAAMSFYVAKVFSNYLSDQTGRVLIWTGAALYPAVTAYLRRDSGHHFRTDVMAGYAAGALIGYLVPELHRKKQEDHLRLSYVYLGDGVRVELNYRF
jgi:membrane-associated phospholipid phosphatase